MNHLLALDLPDYWTWAFPVLVIGVVVQFLWSSVVSIVLYRLAKTDRNIETLQTALQKASDQRIDERFAVIEEIKRQLAKGEGEFRKLVDGDHSLEVKMLKEIAAVRENMITRADLERLREEWRANHA